MTDALRFRDVMGRFTTGVTVVTSRRPDGEPCGLTANSVASVSLDPVLVLVCVDRAAASHGCIVEHGNFAVSILAREDADLAVRFSAGERSGRFEGVELTTATTGTPILAGALAWLDCRVRDVHDAGDHSIVVGEVLECDAREGDPLVFFRGEFRSVRP